jgi:hypothetical protein
VFCLETSEDADPVVDPSFFLPEKNHDIYSIEAGFGPSIKAL